MKLIELWNANQELAFSLFNSFEADENGFINYAYGMSFDMFKQYIEFKRKNSLGVNLRPGYVPDSQYILIDDDNNYVGIFNLRHYLNDFLRDGPGHIGYGICKQYRHKGYATKGLALTLEKAKEIGIKEVYLSCNIDNEASLKAQLNNGGYIHHKDDLHYYTRINLE